MSAVFPHAVGKRTPTGVIVGLLDDTTTPATTTSTIPVLPQSTEGKSIIMETATFVLRMAAHSLLENKELFVRHGFCVENTELSAGIFLEVMGGGGALTDAEFGALSESFAALIETEWPITTVSLTYSEAMERFQNQRSTFTHRLLSQKSEQPVYDCFQIDKYVCLKIGEQVMLPTTKLSALSEVGITLELVPMSNKSGVLLKIVGSAPAPLNDWTLKGLSVGNVWAESTGVTCCGDINRRIMENPASLVRLEELRFDEEVMGCAMSALRSHPDLKVILVSGPSASGKTTFASKLAVALRSLGKVPTVLSTDDYYRDISDPDYPRLNGKLNHETIDALRLPLLQEHLSLLMKGAEVEVPLFDMKVSKPKPAGKMVCLKGNGVLIMEGIFALDPRMISEENMSEEDRSKHGPFSIFISPVPYFAVDEQTFISNRTLRLIRRIARDYRHRGRGAAASINRLDVVDFGEVSAVLPHLAKADYLFNSVMAHEISMLRVYVGPLLTQVAPTDDAFYQAQVLIGLLNRFSSVMDSFLPTTSLLCEFVGTSVFEEAPLVISSEQRPVTGLSVHNAIVATFQGGDISDKMTIAVRSLLTPVSTRQIVNYEVSRRIKAAEASGASPAAIANLQRFTDDLIAVKLNGALTHLDRMVFTSLELEEDADHFLSSPTISNRIVTASGEGTDFKDAELIIDPVLVSGEGAASTIRATLTFLVHVAVRRLYPSRHVVAAHGFGGEETDMQHSAYFLRIHDNHGACVPLTPKEVTNIANEVSSLIKDNAQIRTKTVSLGAAIEYFTNAGMRFSVSLLQSRNESLVDLVQCRGEAALYFQPLCPQAGCITTNCYAIHPYDGGLALAFSIDESLGLSSKEDVPSPVCPEMSEARMGIHRFSDEVRAAAGVGCVGDLNEAIFRGRTREIMQVSEALEQRTISELVTKIRQSSSIKVLLFAGASGSGKSVLTEKLKVQLKAKGLVVRDLILDNYYKNNGADDYPRDKYGNCDFEQVDALRLDDLQRDVEELLEGRAVDGPSFDIGAGKRRVGSTVRIEGVPLENGVLLMEGIFALQDILLPNLPSDRKLRVVVHPTSILNVDELRFVSHQVLRMLRRIVRDYHCRTRDARDILSRWRSVADGEVRNVIPFIDSADILLNASNLYEIGALKSTALPLLNHVSPAFPVEYAQAAQLKSLLDWYYVVPNPDTAPKE